MQQRNELYELLEVSRDAPTADIKRAYRRLALQLHPDKNPSVEAREQFQKVAQAWDVLGDEKLRKVYDAYGQTGVDMYRQLGGDLAEVILDPNAESLAISAFCALTLLLSIVTLFPVFVVLVGDNHVTWYWSAVFSPVWICDLLALLYIVSRYFTWDESSAVDQSQQDDMTPQEWQDKLRRERLLQRALGVKLMLQLLLFFAFQLFIVLQLDTAINWSWASVFAPWFVIEALAFFSNLVASISRCQTVIKIDADGESETVITLSLGQRVLVVVD